ncbi:MAG: sulfatase-like hydrolase/transferase [Lentisphaeria bacterium]|nr:sulfatase-like hydrolase/transferase [Lentisphaeria bacterium]
MTRFRSLCVILLLQLAAGSQVHARPNIVLMMADDQGWGETGYNGHPHLHTPVLDRMAAGALRFDRFYSGAPNCTPTRASVMTGRHANRSGAFAPNWSTRPEEITLAHILRQAGYRTGHFGKWHIGAVKAQSPLNPGRMGFDEYLSHDNFFEMNPPLSRNGAPPEIIPGESSEIIVREAVAFLRRVHAEGKSFFIVVWFGSPHGPYSGLEQDIALYGNVAKEEMRRRFAEITAMDRAIGMFREALRESGVAEDTLLWFNSDNGIPVAREEDSFNGGWRGRKGDLYEGGLRVPAIVEWPAVIRTPRVTALPCVTSDILPTLLDILGLRHPDPQRPLDGISLRPLIEDGSLTERPSPIGFWKYAAGGEKKNGRWVSEELSRGTTPTTRNPAIDFTNYKHPVARTSDFGGAAAWTDNRFKLVRTPRRDGSTGTELFDLIADPGETTDIAAQNPDVVRRLGDQLEAWQRSVEHSLTGADY